MTDLSKEEIINLLNKNWMTHDGTWFLHTMNEFGIEKANALNKAVIQTLATMEVARMKNVFGFEQEKIESFYEFKKFFQKAAEIVIPDFMGGIFEFKDNNIFHVEMKQFQCFAYKGMKRLGVIDKYECGVLYRIECWIKNLGIKYEMIPGVNGCSMHTDKECSRDIKLFF